MTRRLAQSVARRVVAEVVAGTGVGPLEIFSKTQAHRVAHLRQAAMVRLRAVVDADGKPLYSLPEIGRAFARDHTTVIHALRQYSKRSTTKSNPVDRSSLAEVSQLNARPKQRIFGS